MSNNKSLLFIILISNTIFLLAAIHYLLWFNLAKPEDTLNKYLSSIRTGEKQLTVRLVSNFDWGDFKKIKALDYNMFNAALAKAKNGNKIAEMKFINSEKQRDGTIRFNFSFRNNKGATNGSIFLVKDKYNQWKIIKDTIFTQISYENSR